MKKYPCSPNESTCGMLWFPRMLDKIRMHGKKELPEEYVPFLGVGFDGRCLRYLRVEYDEVVEQVNAGRTDVEVFQWCMDHGRGLTEEDIVIWSDFIRKRGLRDNPEIQQDLLESKMASGLGHRDDIDTYFKYNDADEGRDSERQA